MVEDATIACLLERVGQLTGAHSTGLFELDPATGLLHCTHGAGQNGVALRAIVGLRPGQGVVGRAVADGKPAWTADILHDLEIRLPWQHRERMLHLGLRAILAVPVELRNGARAGLVIYHREPHAFDERDAEGLAALAPFVAVALENAQLQRAARE